MQLFSELYGAYFRTVARILSKGECSEQEMLRLIQEEAFRDSILFLPPKLRPESSENWGLLRRMPDGRLARVTRHAPPGFITLLQKRWLKAKLADPRMRLFLSDAVFAALEKELQDITPLFLPQMLRYFDQFSDGDRYDSAHYRLHFRRVLRAVQEGELLNIRFVSGKGKELSGTFLPLKLEYSQKNDKFRVFCCQMGKGKAVGSGMINVGRILEIHGTGVYEDPRKYEADCYARRRAPEPVLVEVTGERNGIERFMMEFAPFEKRTERDPVTGRCLVTLWYDRQDETELLIRLLGFGPVLEILGPPAFRRQAEDRIRRQYALLHS